MARGILLGLELLVAADIVSTVAINLSFASVGVLAVVVLIRTFLSFTLEVEMSGRWPWQRAWELGIWGLRISECRLVIGSLWREALLFSLLRVWFC